MKDSMLIDKYKKVSSDLLKLSFPNLDDHEIDVALDWSISKRFKDNNVVIDNNYKKETTNTTLFEVAEYILNRQPIITSYGVMFSRHGDVPNPIYKMVDKFIAQRKAMKKEMFKHPKGSEDYERYNLLQLLLKIDSNGSTN